MHVLFLTPAYPNPGNPVEGLFNEQLARALLDTGTRVTVLVCKPWLPRPLARRTATYRPLADLPKNEHRKGLTVHYVRHLQLPKYRRPRLTAAACRRGVLDLGRRRLRGRPDLIHVHSTWPVGLAAPGISIGMDVPFLVTLHIEEDPLLLDGRDGRSLHRLMVDRAGSLIPVSRSIERALRVLHPDLSEQKVRVIPNGADLDAAVAALGRVEKREGQPRRLVSVCNLWPVKGVDLNLRALAQLSEEGIQWHSYTVVGDGPERANLESLARTLGIANRVEFTGRLLHAQALERIAAADIFTLPSWREAFGVVYLEAMACGKPVVACREQGAQDFVRHNRHGLLIEPRSVESLVRALRRLLSDSDLVSKLGRQALSQARLYSWQETARLYLDVYRSLCPADR